MDTPTPKNETAPTQREALPLPWPHDTAEIYAELESEDRGIAARMFPLVKETWETLE